MLVLIEISWLKSSRSFRGYAVWGWEGAQWFLYIHWRKLSQRGTFFQPVFAEEYMHSNSFLFHNKARTIQHYVAIDTVTCQQIERCGAVYKFLKWRFLVDVSKRSRHFYQKIFALFQCHAQEYLVINYRNVRFGITKFGNGFLLS